MLRALQAREERPEETGRLRSAAVKRLSEIIWAEALRKVYGKLKAQFVNSTPRKQSLE